MRAISPPGKGSPISSGEVTTMAFRIVYPGSWGRGEEERYLGLLVDYHVHALGHGEAGFDLSNLEAFASAAREAGLAELGLTEHDEFIDLLDWEVWSLAKKRFAPMRLRLGLEISYSAERESEIADMIKLYPFDYLIGSVHELQGWPFDHPDHLDGYSAWDLDDLYQQYFYTVTRAAASGLFHVVGHLDLIKVFGYRSHRPVLELAREALEAIRDCGLTVEINTAGLFKPAGEIYPSPELLEACFALGIPITFGSDAHQPGQVGRGFKQSVDLARRVGYGSYSRFCKGRVETLSL